MVTDSRPAIRWINYMSGRDRMEAVNLIGPYDNTAARDTDLYRLENLPLGAPEYHGGQEFMAVTYREGDTWYDELVSPAQVAHATTVRGFHNVYDGYAEDDDDGLNPDYFRSAPS